MTKIFIDTEFNEFGGELISLALVTGTGFEFYEVLECPNPGPWVKNNVMPMLGKKPISKELFQDKLFNFLMHFTEITIIADWADDIKYFCESLIVGPGISPRHPPISFILDRTLSSGHSKVLHNALYDARAIADMYMGRV
jgi:hypothetical protein